MMNIQLTKNEYDYLIKNDFIPEPYLNIIRTNIDSNLKLTIDEDNADEIREACIDHLLLVGFDEKHETTEEGEMLETLIDKFFGG